MSPPPDTVREQLLEAYCDLFDTTPEELYQQAQNENPITFIIVDEDGNILSDDDAAIYVAYLNDQFNQ